MFCAVRFSTLLCAGKALEDMNLDELDELEDEEEEKILLQMRFVSESRTLTADSIPNPKLFITDPDPQLEHQEFIWILL